MTTKTHATTGIASTSLLVAIASLSPLANAQDALYSHLRGHAHSEVIGSINSSTTGEYVEITDQFEVDSLNDPAAYAAFEQSEVRSFDDYTVLSEGSELVSETVLRIDENPNGFWIIGSTWHEAYLSEGSSYAMHQESHVEVAFTLHQPVIVDVFLRASNARRTQAEGPVTDVWVKNLENDEYAARNLNVDHDDFDVFTEDGYIDRVVLEEQIVLHPGEYAFGCSTSCGSVTMDGPIYEDLYSASNSYIHLTPWTPGDANLDGTVNGADISVLFAYWGTAEPTCDFNNDGRVDGADLNMILAYWN